MISTLVSFASRIGCSVARNRTRNRNQDALGMLVATVCAVCLFGGASISQESGPTLTPAAKMLPEETQAVFALPDSERFLATWGRTQLGKLAADKILKEFWDSQRQEIQDRFKEAGWQLSLEIDDLSDISGGQTALAWIARPNIAAKPFSIALIIDVAGRTAPTENFLKRIDGQLKAKNANAKVTEIAGVKVMQYSLPKMPGELYVRESYYALSKDQLLATDDLATLTELLAAQTGTKAQSLANSELYKAVQAKIYIEGEAPEIEYFVRPIGFAKLLRSISSKPTNNQADILKILDNQGFNDLQCFAGNIQINHDTFDFFHNGYVICKKPTTPSVKILDFPNQKQLVAPDWINKETASVLSFSWDIKSAFPRFKDIVDAYVGDGTFDTVIEGIRDDPSGPQIDFIKEVLPNVTTEFHVVTEVIQPIAPESKRSMVILKLNDPMSKLPKVLDRFGKSEPNAKAIDVEGIRVWRIKNDAEEEVSIDFNTGTSDKNKDKEEESDEHLLDQWAISILDDYLIFASDAEMISDTIRDAKSGKQAGLFAKEADVLHTNSMLKTVAGDDGLSFNQITRADRAFEMQYELFRQGILPESKSMLASVLDKILKPKGPTQGQQQKVNGAKLPPFSQIRSFFTPSAGVVRTEEDGWSLQSFILNK